MNLGYVFDLNGIIDKSDLQIPFLSELQYSKINLKDLTTIKILQIRDDVMADIHTIIDKHLFFFVIKYDKETLLALSKCISGIQNDSQHFNAANYEVHVVCNFMDDGSFNASDYEKAMPCLTNNSVCVYSWFLGQYDSNGDRLIKDKRRAHAISRMVSLVTNHQEISNALIPMAQTTEKMMPVYNLFGDSSVFFDEEGRTQLVRNLYCFKNIQHLLNLPDNRIDDYMRENVIPFADDRAELDKRIDATSDDFLKQQRVPIEASLITQQTQGLLLKSSDDDEEYLVNATDNKLVFLDQLSKAEGWQLKNMEVFLTGYQDKVGIDMEVQEVVSDEFLEKLYKENYIIHEKDGFNEINNNVSDSRKTHIDKFKKNVDKRLNDYLNQNNNGNYTQLRETLTHQDTYVHRSNLDFGIAFMEYLKAGKGEYLSDKDVAMGDINFETIKNKLEKEERKRRQDYEDKKKEIDEKYKPGDDDQPSKIKEKFNQLDQKIKECRSEKKYCDYQIQHLIDTDSDKKLTASAKSLIALCSGVFAAVLWLVISIKWLSGFMKNVFEHYGRFQWIVFGGIFLAGVIVGAVIFAKAWLRRKEAIEALEEARQQKKNIMDTCVKEMNDVTELHYDFLLAYHGLKTINELIDYVTWKKEDIVSFRKTLFKLMCLYKLNVVKGIDTVEWNDDNTIELLDETVVSSILFGTETQRREIPYCFAQQGIVLSDTFAEFKRKKVRWETTRNSLSHTSQTQSFDQASLEKEVIACLSIHNKDSIVYTPLKETSILPADTNGVEMDDIHQGACGDCYFMATLAAIAKMKPEYIIGKNGMVEELGDEHRFFRVKFYDKDGVRVNVDVDNRFWNQGGHPIYAGKGNSNDPKGNSYDPWVMAVEKAWAKANNDGYQGIVGTSDSKELMRHVEYSFAVTGKSAFYCKTKSVPDGNKLRDMIRKHFCDDKLPITLYSVSKDNARFADPTIVSFHAYALQSVYDDGTFDIFNPWNSHGADEDIQGKHYEKVDINFIKDNFDVVVFFGIQEADFDSLERNLTDNAPENEVIKGIEMTLNDSFAQLNLSVRQFEDLLKDEERMRLLTCSEYLFSRNNVRDPRGVEGSVPLLFLEGIALEGRDAANTEMQNYLNNLLPGGITLHPMLYRHDNKQSLTLFRLSPHYVLANFQ